MYSFENLHRNVRLPENRAQLKNLENLNPRGIGISFVTEITRYLLDQQLPSGEDQEEFDTLMQQTFDCLINEIDDDLLKYIGILLMEVLRRNDSSLKILKIPEEVTHMFAAMHKDPDIPKQIREAMANMPSFAKPFLPTSDTLELILKDIAATPNTFMEPLIAQYNSSIDAHDDIFGEIVNFFTENPQEEEEEEEDCLTYKASQLLYDTTISTRRFPPVGFIRTEANYHLFFSLLKVFESLSNKYPQSKLDKIFKNLRSQFATQNTLMMIGSIEEDDRDDEALKTLRGADQEIWRHVLDPSFGIDLDLTPHNLPLTELPLPHNIIDTIETKYPLLLIQSRQSRQSYLTFDNLNATSESGMFHLSFMIRVLDLIFLPNINTSNDEDHSYFSRMIFRSPHLTQHIAAGFHAQLTNLYECSKPHPIPYIPIGVNTSYVPYYVTIQRRDGSKEKLAFLPNKTDLGELYELILFQATQFISNFGHPRYTNYKHYDFDDTSNS